MPTALFRAVSVRYSAPKALCPFLNAFEKATEEAGKGKGLLLIAFVTDGTAEAVRKYGELKFIGFILIQATSEVSVWISSACRFLKPGSFPSLREVGRQYLKLME